MTRGVYKYEPLKPFKEIVDMIFCFAIGYGYALDFNWKYYLTHFSLAFTVRIILIKLEKRL